MQEQSIPATLLILLSYCPFLSLSFTSPPHSLAPSPLAFLSPPFISCYRYSSLLFYIIALVLSFFTSLSKEPDVFLVWFIQIQRLGLRVCCRQIALCVSSDSWVYFLPSFIMQISSLTHMNWTFHLLWTEEIASSVRAWHNVFFQLLAYA